MKIIFSGSIGRFPIGGHAWVHMQYLAGLQALGHEVFYLEDCGEGSWVYNWETEETTTELDYPGAYVRHCLDAVGLNGKWIYRAGDQTSGMTLSEFIEVCTQADLFIVYAVPLAVWRPEYMQPRRRIFIDIDPGFIQISIAKGHQELTSTIERCERLFTIAQRMGATDCAIPTVGYEWLRTVAPVWLPQWPVAGNNTGTHFTSVMQWRGFRDTEYQGVLYGQKDKEFPKFVDLPGLTDQPFLIALTGTSSEKLILHGWEVMPGWIPSKTPESYRQFIQNSRAEFGVAKQGYVQMRGGWFSDRSVCYLASGRPVLLQDTGLGDWLPVGEGIITFDDVPGALRGIQMINANYEQHRSAARRIAEEYFSTERVLPPLLDAAMN